MAQRNGLAPRHLELEILESTGVSQPLPADGLVRHRQAHDPAMAW